MFAKIEITGTLEVLTGMHIGGSSAFAAIGAECAHSCCVFSRITMIFPDFSVARNILIPLTPAPQVHLRQES